MTKVKIKIYDNSEIREEIDNLYSITNQKLIAKWAIEIAKHILLITNIDYCTIPEIIEGFIVNENWQNDKARMYDVRQVGFKIHKLARLYNDNEVKKYALRVVGQAVASGHMKEHAIVASDYAIKLINIMYHNDLEKVTEERNWQLRKLNETATKE